MVEEGAARAAPLRALVFLLLRQTGTVCRARKTQQTFTEAAGSQELPSDRRFPALFLSAAGRSEGSANSGRTGRARDNSAGLSARAGEDVARPRRHFQRGGQKRAFERVARGGVTLTSFLQEINFFGEAVDVDLE